MPIVLLFPLHKNAASCPRSDCRRAASLATAASLHTSQGLGWRMGAATAPSGLQRPTTDSGRASSCGALAGVVDREASYPLFTAATAFPWI